MRGVSDRIRVHGIVGRFLEHAAIYYFENGGEPEVYLGSADWVPRNLHERVEVLFPLKNPLLRDRVVHEILSLPCDNVKARFLWAPDGRYTSALVAIAEGPEQEASSRRGSFFSAQDFLIALAEGTATPEDIPEAAPRRASTNRVLMKG